MTRVEFIKLAAEKAEMTQKEMGEALEAIEDTLMEDVFAEEESVRLKIGTFSGYTRESAARTGRNPKTGEPIKIPAKKQTGYPRFKPSSAAKS